MNGRYLGIDAGSRYVKTAVIEEGRVIETELVSSIEFNKNHAEELQDLKNKFTGVGLTGYGRSMLEDKFDPGHYRKITEITAAAKAAEFEKRKAGSILDIGGQDTKVIRLSDGYRISDFRLNDKCAAGTGKFIELILNSLDIKMNSLKDLEINNLNEPDINSTCAVFAETEVIQLLYRGHTKEELVSAVFKSIARKVIITNAGLIKGPVLFIGGAANFVPLQKWVEKISDCEVIVPSLHWFNNAIGAAVAARQKS